MKNIREKLILTKDEARDILNGLNEEFKVIQDKVVYTTRYLIVNELVVQRLSDNKFFADSYNVGATESQDERPWKYSEPDFKEVFSVEKVITVYE